MATVVALFGMTILAIVSTAVFFAANSETTFRCAVVLILWAIWAAVMR
jgi:hypothetical protein